MSDKGWFIAARPYGLQRLFCALFGSFNRSGTGRGFYPMLAIRSKEPYPTRPSLLDTQVSGSGQRQTPPFRIPRWSLSTSKKTTMC